MNPRTSEGLKYDSNITIAEMNDKLGLDLASTRWITLTELEQYHVRLMNGTKIENFFDKETIISKGDMISKIEADYVILVTGYQSIGKELVQCLKKASMIIRSLVMQKR